MGIFPNFHGIFSIFSGIPLEFVRPLPEIALTEVPSEPVVLECELSRRPTEELKWLRSGKPLPSRLPKHVSVDELKGKTVHRLTLTEVTEEELGEYTVQVENIASTGKLDMKGEWGEEAWYCVGVSQNTSPNDMSFLNVT